MPHLRPSTAPAAFHELSHKRESQEYSYGQVCSKRLTNCVITIENREDRHREIIQSAVAKRAYQIFETRGCKHGFDLEDWISAEKNSCAMTLMEIVRISLSL